MANRRTSIPSKELALKVVGPRESAFLPRVQRLNLDFTQNSTDIDEHGNSQHAGTTTDIPEVTVSFSAFDVGIKIFSVLTGTNPSAFPSAGVDIKELGEIDAIFYVKDASSSDYVKSAHAKRLQIRTFTFSYSVDGQATEEYNAVGTEKRWFKNDVVVDRFTTPGTTQTLSQTPIVLKNGNYCLSVIKDGVYLTEVTGTPGAGEYKVSGTTLTLGETFTNQCLAVYHANPAGSNWNDVRDASMPAAITGKDVKIVIGANNIDRVQSVTINGNLRPEAVREMGNRNLVGYTAQVPTVDGTITVLDTDTELMDLFVTGNPSSGDTEFSFESSCSASGVSLEIKLIDPCDTTLPYTVLKTIYIPTITIVGDSFTSNVNGNASQTFNFKSSDAQCIIYSGAR